MIIYPPCDVVDYRVLCSEGKYSHTLRCLQNSSTSSVDFLLKLAANCLSLGLDLRKNHVNKKIKRLVVSFCLAGSLIQKDVGYLLSLPWSLS